ncbi:MAG TPA: FAD-dependent oxidoreductase [Roseiflexaceae bacterium]|nr:FAD-dependent oxidoreductase [Roseiflexaceae bacterium]
MMKHDAMPDEAAHDLPVLLIVDADRKDRVATESALLRRFAPDYRVLTAASAAAGLDALERLAHQGNEVALVAADLDLSEMDGIAFLERARALHRCAMRALFVDMDNRGTRIPFAALDALQRATALGRIDFWVVKGWRAPEELLYPYIQEALTAWTKTNRPHHAVFRVVGERWSPRSHELRDVIARNTVPFRFYDVDSDEGRQLLHDYGVDVERLPAVILNDGSVLHQPTYVDIAHALGVHTQPSSEVYDLAILGAGPSGLAAAVYGASEGLRTLVIEPQAIGGQAGTSSMIRNYLGFPWGVSGSELAFRAFEQTLLFGAQFVFQQRATGMTIDNHEHIVTLTDGCEARARAVMIAAGVDYRRVGIPALERLVGVGVFYGAAQAEAPALVGEDVYVIGGANSAGQAALHLARFAARVTLLVRGESLEASMSDYLIIQLQDTPNIHVRLRTRVVDGRGAERLETLLVEDGGTGQREEVAAAAVFIMIGAEPRTDWLRDIIHLDDRGFILTSRDIPVQAWPLERPPLPYETSMPGVFAVGDVRHGSVKRVAGAVGEGSVAVGSVHQYLAELAAGIAGRK